MGTAWAQQKERRAWRWEIFVAAMACAVLLACGGEVSIGRTPQSTHDAGLPSVEGIAASPRLDSGAPAPAADQGRTADGGSAADSTASQCPAAEEIAGSYAGGFSGALQALIEIPLTGTISFDVLPGSGTTRLMKNGKVHVVVLGLTFDLTMEGEVACGKLLGQGGATIAGVQFSGAFLGQWQAGGFPNGSWNGQDVNSTKGSGNWTATRK